MTTEILNRSKGIVVLMLALAACLACCLMLPSQARADGLAAGDGSALSAQSGQADKAQLTTQKAKVYKISTAAQWHNISKYNGGTFKIVKDISLPSEGYYLNIRKSKKYTIDLNGHTVKTAYADVPLRTAAPLNVAGGTVILKDSKKKRGMLYSTETAAVVTQGYAKFYLKNARVANNAAEFRSDITSGIMTYGKSKCYVQGTSQILSIGNGIATFEKSKLYITGNPWVRAGYNIYRGQFMHYGSAISIASKYSKASIKGGSYGTMASPDIVYNNGITSMRYTQSANYPILDQWGYSLKKAIPKGKVVVDQYGNVLEPYKPGAFDYYNGTTAPDMEKLIEKYGVKASLYYQVFETDSSGFYTVRVVNKK